MTAAAAAADPAAALVSTGSKLTEISDKALIMWGKVKTMSLTPISAHLIGAALFVSLIIASAVLLVVKTRLKDTNDDNMKEIYKDNTPVNRKLTSINNYDEQFSYLLRDYHVKTAYNCCGSGNFTNDWVSTNALTTVISQGARCLDFEIYSLDGIPVISSSSQSEYTMKETLNYVSLSEAFDIIIVHAFAPDKCPNKDDPLLLCLRIKSNNIVVFNEIAKLLEKKLASRLLDSRYGYAYNGDNLGRVPLSNFMGKIIIIIDETPGPNTIVNEIHRKTSLYEFANIIIRGPTSKKTFSDVTNPSSQSAVVEYSKKNIVFVLPERSTKAENQDAVAAHNQGHQLVAMSFQSNDAAMIAYNTKFDEARHAFILKLPKLRYTPLTVDAPTPVDPNKALNSQMTGEDAYGRSIQG